MTPDELLESVTTAIHYAAGGTLNVHDSRHLARSAIAIVVERCERLATDHWHFADVRDEEELAPMITICQDISDSIRSLCPPPGGHVPGTQQEPTSGTTGQAGGAVAVLPAIPGGENP